MDREEMLKRYNNPELIVEDFSKALWPRHVTMDPGIRPIFEDVHIAGPAVTVENKAGSAATTFAVDEFVKPGDIIVIDAAGDTTYPVAGAMHIYYLQKKGVKGFIIDGVTCDIKQLRAMKFPMFCRGQSPALRRTGGGDKGKINVPINCGGQVVRPGDIIVANDDGVAVIGADEAEQALELAESIVKFDAKSIRRLDEGKSWSELNLEKGENWIEWAEQP